MARSHEPLIRLARFKVEELQKQMAELDRSKQALINQIERLEASVPEEQAIATQSKDGYLAYGSYAQAVIKRKDNIRASLSEVEAQSDTLRDRLSEAFQELKKYELLEERRLARAEAAVREAEQAELDEMASIRHRRAH
ncbi:MAG: flagellar export protein FliJ [Maricaulis sp.]|uniref:flagellar export protein FliJ n=1 Tax=Maricaulis sp. TaxID=1486257 RepID=UPI001B1240D2|nr:flagellar export protein FliJ [Maricaulis sp.]MBO6729441.1 flagellar export protein FliJ [Maricaulis sp.]MBO6847956.1 flagellar export protein FliJ [Maricaulis sp.]MBO6877666.1 flagellar export protein FliJ [Maricaulis sp.]